VKTSFFIALKYFAIFVSFVVEMPDLDSTRFPTLEEEALRTELPAVGG